MCGISGIYSKYEHHHGDLAEMLDSIKHRGPDGASRVRDGPLSAGAVRLAINDVSGGGQPFYNKKKTICVFYNGEIYNFRDLRRSLDLRGYTFSSGCDGDILPAMYEVYGQRMFELLDGMFAIALWLSDERRLILARDPQGEKPLYYSRLDNGFGLAFGSEIRTFRRLTKLRLTTNRESIWDFPSFLWIPEPLTIYNEVRSVSPGEVITFDGMSISRSRMEQKRAGLRNQFANDEEAILETKQVVDYAIRSRLMSDVRVGAFLSGGLDSAIVVSRAKKELGQIETFNVAFETGPDACNGVYDESLEALETANSLGTSHSTIRLTAKGARGLLDDFVRFGDQPFAVSSGLGILAVSQQASYRGIKVLLSGDCADETFGGYPWYLQLAQQSRETTADAGITPEISFNTTGLALDERLRVLSNYTSHQRAWAWHYYASESDKRDLFSEEFGHGQPTAFRHFRDWNESTTWTPEMYIDNDRDFYMVNEMLTKLDRMTMASSVEGRAPFASRAVRDHASRLSLDHLIGGFNLKRVLREAYRKEIPETCRIRPKHGFNVPIDQWLKGEWKDLVDETFAQGSALWAHGFIDKKSRINVSKLLSDTARLNGHSVFCFIVLNRWLELSK